MRETKAKNRRLNAAVGASNQVLFFSEPRQWRRWLEDHHAKAQELWVGFHKKSSGQPSIAWPQAVDEALCFGWIDGIRKSIDDTRYRIRFTPRRAGSIWSKVNVGRARALSDLGLMAPAGLKAFGDRTEAHGVFPVEAAGLPQTGDPVGDQRKAGTDPTEAIGEADRRFTQRANYSAADPQTKVGVHRGG